MNTRQRVVVAGASGFVGEALGRHLRREASPFELVGLSRGPREGHGYDVWTPCDLFSLKDAERALDGAKFAIYLVHSMSRSARLVQGRFEDLDLICADNFGRAAKRAGVEQIIYLGGLLPAEGDPHELSRHLASRREVELALGDAGVPVTTLRAGMVLGARGSSYEMMVRLVRRLPVMIAPSWTGARCQPIDLDTTVKLLVHVLADESSYGKTFDVGGPDVLTYREMMLATAEVLGIRRRRIFPIPLLSPRLSKGWVSLVTGAPLALVAPLVESMRHDMVTREQSLQREAGLPGLSFRAAVAEAARASARQSSDASQEPAAYGGPSKKAASRGVRSVQRVPLPHGRDALWAAYEYMSWLPRGTWPFLRVEIDHARLCRFFFARMNEPLLELRFAPERSTGDRQLFYVTGGLLARATERGRFELRVTPDGESLLTAVHEFSPQLPWFLYRYTQAIVHGLVMDAFGRHLARVQRRAAKGPRRKDGSASHRSVAGGDDRPVSRDREIDAISVGENAPTRRSASGSRMTPID